MKTFFSVLFSITVFTSIAQTGTTVSGNVSDEQKSSLEFVNVLMLNAADSSMMKGAITDATGKFEFENVQPGSYMFQLMMMGYENQFTQVVAVQTAPVNLGGLTLKSSSAELGAVEVATMRPIIEMKPDMTVFNVENTINATGNTAMELLRKSPGVMVDNNDNIMLKGRSGVQVWIDGKPSPVDGDALAAMLNNMQSSNIAAIEIITNPGAKYDAAGTAGIINIRLKKNKNFGSNGTVSMGYAYGKAAKYNGALAFNHRNEKINAFANYGIWSGRNENWMDLYRVQNGNIFNQSTTMSDSNLPHNMKAGIDFFINSKNTLGIVANGNISDESSENSSRTFIGPEDNSSVDSVLVSDVKMKGYRNNGNFNLNYQFNDTAGTTFKTDFDYGTYRFSNTSYQPNTYYNASEEAIITEHNYRTITPTDISIYSAKADYERNALKGQLGIGVKSSLVETDNTFNFYNIEEGVDALDSAKTNNFKYSENINAAYINYKRQWTKIGMQLGARMEQTVSEGVLDALAQEDESNDTTYMNLFPSAALSYTMDQMNSFTLSYSRRIDRPSYQDLNPFEFKLDELSYMKGNPFLKPQYTQNIELAYAYGWVLNTSLTYAYTKDFSTMNIYSEGNASYVSQTNLGYQQYGALSVSSPLELKKWWSIFVTATSYYQRTKADLDDGRKIDIDFISYNGYAQSTWSLPKDFSFELSGWFNGPGLWGGSFKNSPMGSLDVGLKKTFMDNRATFKAAFTDVLKTAHWRGISDFDAQYMDARGGWESQQIRLDFSLRFGNMNVKVREKKGGAEDLNSRVK